MKTKEFCALGRDLNSMLEKLAKTIYHLAIYREELRLVLSPIDDVLWFSEFRKQKTIPIAVITNLRLHLFFQIASSLISLKKRRLWKEQFFSYLSGKEKLYRKLPAFCR